MPAAAGVDAALGSVRRRQRLLDLTPGAKAVIEEPGRVETRERGRVLGEMLGLPAHRLFPPHAEPREVLVDRGLELAARPSAVDVLDAEEEASPTARRGVEGEKRRVGVSEVEVTVRARRETRHEGRRSGHSLAFLAPSFLARDSLQRRPVAARRVRRLTQLAFVLAAFVGSSDAADAQRSATAHRLSQASK